MILENYRKTAYKFTGKLSDINRHLAFVGIAIIWIFREQQKDLIKIPSELLMPLVFIGVSLFLDLVQYIYFSLIWRGYVWCHEKKKTPENKKIDHPFWYPIPGDILLFLKVFLNLIGYMLLLFYLSKELF